MVQKIITLTVDPAIDVHIRSNDVSKGTDSSFVVVRRDMGGKGVNVSRALSRLGLSSVCYVIAGRENSESYLSCLKADGLRVVGIDVKGAIRENRHIHTPTGDSVIPATGPIVDREVVNRLRGLLLGEICEGTPLIFSGGISDGSDKEAIIELLLEAKRRGAALVLDSRSLEKKDIATLGPLMIKPNLEEAEKLLGYPLVEGKSVIDGIAELSELGVEYVLLTLGSRGLALYHEGECLMRDSYEVTPISTVGAGDGTVASFVYSYLRGFTLVDMARHAVACGTAACMTEGTLPPDPCQIKFIFDELAKQ